MNQHYRQQGYALVKGFLTPHWLTALNEVIEHFHQNWVADNQAFYATRAVNSAYLTGLEYLDNARRNTLFRFIASDDFMRQVHSVLPCPAFMNTQLFFNPQQPEQRNYWHRDPQYHLDLEQQKAALSGPQVIHFRLALKAEPGIELIPGSHVQWDTGQQLNVRLEQNGQRNYDPLPEGRKIALEAGDLLIFSANMIHRGLYGLDRMALDVLMCEAEPELLRFVRPDCLPDASVCNELDNPAPFELTMKHLA